MCQGRAVMSQATLVLPADISHAITAALRNKLETAWVLLVGVGIDADHNVRLLARELLPVPDSGYTDRQHDQMVISSHGYVLALARAEQIGAAALWVHTHPGAGASPRPSRRDRRVDDAIAELFKIRTGHEAYGAVVFASGDDQLAFSGHLDLSGKAMPISRLWEVGDRLRLTREGPSRKKAVDSALFDRNIRAFGGGIQSVLGDLHVGVVGCGGTGSAVAEQLVRLGVRHLTLIDPDSVSESNLTRVYGSTPQEVGQNKASVLGAHLRRIVPTAHVVAVEHTVTTERGARSLTGCDAIFGCTDDNAGRLVLSRLAAYFLTPVIDCGVLLTTDAADLLTGIDGRVTILAPGSACLVCRNRIDLRRAQAEVLTPTERRRLQDEGYAAALPGIEPAVVTFTTAIAAIATGELLERLVGYGPEPVPSEILLRFHEREISTNVAAPRHGHYCDPAAGKLGFGDGSPFLEQTWGA